MARIPIGRLLPVVAALASFAFTGCSDDGAGPAPPSDTPVCELSTETIDFEYVTIGGSSDAAFVIKNTGAGTLSGEVTESHDCYEIIAGGGAYALSADESVTVTVRFGPTAPGNHECSIETGSSRCGNVLCTGKGAYEWTPMTSNTSNSLNAVWGSSGNDVFAVGLFGTIVHYDGTSWSVMGSGVTTTLYDVWGSSGSNVFAVGSGGRILRYNGSSWSQMTSPTTTTLNGIHGTSGSDIYAVGEYGSTPFEPIILHYDGGAWSEMGHDVTATYFVGVWCNALDDVYIIGNNDVFHYNGTSLSAVDIGNYILHFCLWGLSGDCIWIGSAIRTFDYFDGAAWTHFDTGSEPWKNVYGIWGSAADNIFAVGYPGDILHFDGESWCVMAQAPTDNMYDIWGTGESDIFAVGHEGTIIHYGP